jgi:tRNA pseudouridine38-40 synthase
MTVAYDGSSFFGFARQPGFRTVAGTLEAALELVVRHPVVVTGAGRTDRGVHAAGQVVSFDVAVERFDAEVLRRALNRLCAPALVATEVAAVPVDFDARFSARARRYHYTVLNRSVPDPFLWATTWHVPEPLALPRLRLACDPLIGEHDFSSFCRRPRHRRADRDGACPGDGCGGTDGGSGAAGGDGGGRGDGGDVGSTEGPGDGEVSLRRRVVEAGWEDLGDGLLRFHIEANAFCHQMVRSIVGLLVEVGRGRRRAGDVAGIIRARDRTGLPTLAPARGLCLWQVSY